MSFHWVAHVAASTSRISQEREDYHLNRLIARIEDVDGATGSAPIENDYFLHDGDDVVAR